MKVGFGPPVTEYGWDTNSATKPTMIFALVKAVNDGLLQLSDEDLIAEAKNYTRNDLIDEVRDVRLTTRHFDLLMAAAIAWQMKAYAHYRKEETESEVEEELDMLYPQIGI